MGTQIQLLRFSGKVHPWSSKRQTVARRSYLRYKMATITLFLPSSNRPFITLQSAQKRSWTPLMQAALEGNVVNLAELLHTGALVNVKEANGLTALSIAISLDEPMQSSFFSNTVLMFLPLMHQDRTR